MFDLNKHLYSKKDLDYLEQFRYSHCCYIGPKGPKGDKGNPGPMGPQGNIGLMGIQGKLGLPGLEGNPGSMGPQGEMGPMGLQGEMGPMGLQGNIGPMGLQGNVGPKGLQGSVGPMGLQGNIGPMGLQGNIGPMGPQGEVGPKGLQGDIGPAGPQGEMGPQGETGPMGLQGNIGPMGREGQPITTDYATFVRNQSATYNDGDLFVFPGTLAQVRIPIDSTRALITLGDKGYYKITYGINVISVNSGNPRAEILANGNPLAIPLQFSLKPGLCSIDMIYFFEPGVILSLRIINGAITVTQNFTGLTQYIKIKSMN